MLRCDTRILGSALILAGTSIGAGMLALPLVAGDIGFVPMLIIFFITAFFMAYSALLMFEANLIIGKGSSLYVMAAKVLGRPGKAIATFTPLGLFYSLMAAYLAGGGGMLHELLASWCDVEMPMQIATIAFAVVAGCIVFYSTQAVDYINRLLFLLMLSAFFVALFCLFPNVQYSHLQASGELKLGIWVALPIVFTSFGFHGSIPSVILYERDNTAPLPTAFILGIILPLIFYILWLIVSVGNLSAGSLADINKQGGSVGNMIASLSERGGFNHIVDTFLFSFSNLALLTSILGVALGLFDYLASLFQRQDTAKGRVQTACLTFIPPTLFALLYPDGFVAALGYAAIALSLLAILLPAAIVWKLRKEGSQCSFRAPGGNGLILVTSLFGVVIIIAQVVSIVGR